MIRRPSLEQEREPDLVSQRDEPDATVRDELDQIRRQARMVSVLEFSH